MIAYFSFHPKSQEGALSNKKKLTATQYMKKDTFANIYKTIKEYLCQNFFLTGLITFILIFLTKLNPVMSLLFWTSKECTVTLHCHYTQIYTDPVIVSVGIQFIGQIDLFENNLLEYQILETIEL